MSSRGPKTVGEWAQVVFAVVFLVAVVVYAAEHFFDKRPTTVFWIPAKSGKK
jgi:hypothetical protein